MSPSRRTSAERPAGALSCRDVVKEYDGLPALAGVDLEVRRGERVVLIGANGSGKTTLIRIVAGLLEPGGGEVRVLGAACGSMEARSVTAYIPDSPVLYDDLSVMEHLEYTARLFGASEWRPKAEELLERLGLADRADDLPARFSRGLRQKTAAALAFVRPFRLLLVDEPFVGLDAPGREAVVSLVEESASDGAAVVVATHQPDYVAASQRCVAMRDGAVVHDGPLSERQRAELLG